MTIVPCIQRFALLRRPYTAPTAVGAHDSDVGL
jgi:hypothetical protein